MSQENDSNARHLVLGAPLDQIFNAMCKQPFQLVPGECPTNGGLILPTPSFPGTGNIIIRGRAGTGKTTLGLQIATEAVRRNDGIYAAYISLEEDPSQIFGKAKGYGWSPYVWPLNRLHEPEHHASVESLAKDLADVLDQPMQCRTTGKNLSMKDRGQPEKDCAACQRIDPFPCPFLERCKLADADTQKVGDGEFTLFPGKVVLPQLEPRVFSAKPTGDSDDSLFWTRYHQLDDLLKAAKRLREVGTGCEGASSSLKNNNGAEKKVHTLNQLVRLLGELLAGLPNLSAKLNGDKLVASRLSKRLHLLKRRLANARRPVDESERKEHKLLDKALNAFRHYWTALKRSSRVQEFDARLKDVAATLDSWCMDDEHHKLDGCVPRSLWPSGPFDKSLAIVCIDSLNVLGSAGLTRDHLAALFDLFKRRQVIGVFIVEENERGVFAGDNPIDSDTIDYLSDMVIELTSTLEEGYYVRHLQVTKSRYQKYILGKHPFKTDDRIECDYRSVTQMGRLDDLIIGQLFSSLRQSSAFSFDGAVYGHTKGMLAAEQLRRQRRSNGIRILPSLHFIVGASDCNDNNQKRSERPENERGSGEGARTLWTHENLAKVIRLDASGRPDLGIGSQVIAVTGPATTGKSLIAGNFLMCGLANGEDVLLIRFAEQTSFSANGCRMAEPASQDVQAKAKPLPEGGMVLWDNKKEVFCRESSKESPEPRPTDSDKTHVKALAGMLEEVGRAKIQYAIHYYDAVTTNAKSSDDDASAFHPVLIELAMKPGYILPEEFVEIVRLVYRWEREVRERQSFGIRRAALIQVGAIGVSYPLLYRSSTASALFLPSLVHILRCRNTDLLITAQTGGVAQSEEMVKKAESLADHVINCQHCDVFGDRYITVTGPGLIERDMVGGHTPETVPGVLRRRRWAGGADYFEIDFDTLQGMVGFSTGHIRRPGITLQLFEEGTLHNKYNSQVSRLVEFAIGATSLGKMDPATNRNPAQGALNGISDRDAPLVTLDTFDSTYAASFHGSLNLLHDTPLHNTVLRTIDEFSVLKLPEINVSRGNPDKKKILTHHMEQRLLYSSLYYRNVLMLACDSETSLALASWLRIPNRQKPNYFGLFWKEVESLVTKKGVTFICDRLAPETFSCLAMDGILCLGNKTARRGGKPDKSGHKIKDVVNLWEIPPPLPEGKKAVSVWPELHTYVKVLASVLPHAVPLIEDHDLSPIIKQKFDGNETAPRYIILGWYSHIREMTQLLLTESGPDGVIRRKLVSEMGVVPLPGGGFTGDWYLHVPSGSVSESLGMKVKKALLDPKEDFRRFIQGVGLPCWPMPKDAKGRKGHFGYDADTHQRKGESLEMRELWVYAESRYDDLLRQESGAINDFVAAWPGSRVALKDVLEIHGQANLRSNLEGYQDIRGELSEIMEHIRAAGGAAATGMAPIHSSYDLLGVRGGSVAREEMLEPVVKLIVALLQRTKPPKSVKRRTVSQFDKPPSKRVTVGVERLKGQKCEQR